MIDINAHGRISTLMNMTLMNMTLIDTDMTMIDNDMTLIDIGSHEHHIGVG